MDSALLLVHSGKMTRLAISMLFLNLGGTVCRAKYFKNEGRLVLMTCYFVCRRVGIVHQKLPGNTG